MSGTRLIDELRESWTADAEILLVAEANGADGKLKRTLTERRKEKGKFWDVFVLQWTKESCPFVLLDHAPPDTISDSEIHQEFRIKFCKLLRISGTLQIRIFTKASTFPRMKSFVTS